MGSQRVIITSPFIFRQICRQIRKPTLGSRLLPQLDALLFFGDILGRVAGNSTSSSAA